jgi:hypothetical protein
MRGNGSWLWLGLIGAAAAAYLSSRPKSTPLSIYPRYAYTAQTSMAARENQQAPAAIPPVTQFRSVQAKQDAVLANMVRRRLV